MEGQPDDVTSVLITGKHKVPSPSVDMTAHTGIRGFAALWILVFHCAMFCEYKLDWQGAPIMPLFFLLSGFSLGIVYGRKPVKCYTGEDPIHIVNLEPYENNALPKFETFTFWNNRFARIMPMYYVTSAIATASFLNGHGYLPPSTISVPLVIVNILPISAWVFYTLGRTVNGPAWTISTLWGFWIVFPFAIPYWQRMSNRKLSRSICYLYWIQMLILVGIYVTIEFTPTLQRLYTSRYFLGAYFPPSRIPVFMMGVFAALLCIRHSSVEYRELPWAYGPILWLPFNCSIDESHRTSDEDILNLEGPKRRAQNPSGKRGDAESNVTYDKWARRVDICSFTLLGVFVLASVGDSVERIWFKGNGIYGKVWNQALSSFAMLTVLVGLTRDEGRSLTSRAMRTAFFQWLGRISSSLYLIHKPVQELISWIVIAGGKNTIWPRDAPECTTIEKYDERECLEIEKEFALSNDYSVAYIPLMIFVSLIAAECAYRLIENPARKFLKRTIM